MVPVGEGEDELFIVEILVGIFRVVNDERGAQAIRVLPLIVRVVPVSAGLVDLEKSSASIHFQGFRDLL